MIYKTIYRSCVEKNNRFQEDLTLKKVLEFKEDISFVDLKLIKDNQVSSFNKMLRELE